MSFEQSTDTSTTGAIGELSAAIYDAYLRRGEVSIVDGQPISTTSIDSGDVTLPTSSRQDGAWCRASYHDGNLTSLTAVWSEGHRLRTHIITPTDDGAFAMRCLIEFRKIAAISRLERAELNDRLVRRIASMVRYYASEEMVQTTASAFTPPVMKLGTPVFSEPTLYMQTPSRTPPRAVLRQQWHVLTYRDSRTCSVDTEQQ